MAKNSVTYFMNGSIADSLNEDIIRPYLIALHAYEVDIHSVIHSFWGLIYMYRLFKILLGGAPSPVTDK